MGEEVKRGFSGLALIKDIWILGSGMEWWEWLLAFGWIVHFGMGGVG